MRARGTLTAVLAGAVTLLAVVGAASPVAAHGAPDGPVSRTMACAPDGPYVRSDACQAALAASGRQSFDDWDYVRVAGVDGRDRDVIPDGALCSGGVPGFAGLDLARADWPTTQVQAGAELTFSYRTTIPHQGEFRLYVTKDGYDSTEPLAWSDLEAEPFLTVTDPELVDGAYRLPGQLPDKTGRHVVFTIWQNFDTPDTYYACSDVVFGPPVSEPSSPPSSPPSSSSASTVASPAAEAVGQDASSRPPGDSVVIALVVATGLAGMVVVVAIVRRRRPRGLHRIG